VWLDNNPTERGLRGPVVGRRNHFGSKSARGTLVAATIYSLVESAKVARVDPVAYLVEVATRAKRAPGSALLPADFNAVRVAPAGPAPSLGAARRATARRYDSTVFAGEGGEALVFNSIGQMFRGNLGDKAAFRSRIRASALSSACSRRLVSNQVGCHIPFNEEGIDGVL